MKQFSAIFLAALLAVSTGCKSDSLAVAKDFVFSLNEYYEDIHGAKEKFHLVKGHTNRPDWIVIKDQGTGMVSVVDISTWSIGSNRLPYLGDLQGNQVTQIGANSWRDSRGYVYQRSHATSKDLQKIGSYLQARHALKLANCLAVDFGMSRNRALEVARLYQQWSRLSKSTTLTSADAEAFSMKLLGFKISDCNEAYSNRFAGNGKAWDRFVLKAARLNQMTPENLVRMMEALN